MKNHHRGTVWKCGGPLCAGWGWNGDGPIREEKAFVKCDGPTFLIVLWSQTWGEIHHIIHQVAKPQMKKTRNDYLNREAVFCQKIKQCTFWQCDGPTCAEWE